MAQHPKVWPVRSRPALCMRDTIPRTKPRQRTHLAITTALRPDTYAVAREVGPYLDWAVIGEQKHAAYRYGGGPGIERVVAVLKRASAAGGNQWHLQPAGNSSDKIDIVSFHRAISIDRAQHNFAGVRLLQTQGPLKRIELRH